MRSSRQIRTTTRALIEISPKASILEASAECFILEQTSRSECLEKHDASSSALRVVCLRTIIPALGLSH
jgi:hypothetical protein